MKHNAFRRSSVLTAAAASMFFGACDYIGNITPPTDDPSTDIPKSSSSITVQSSTTVIPHGSFETWYGAYKQEQIRTGMDNGTETSGYWYVFDDSDEGGLSRVVWPVPIGNEYNINSLEPVINECEGVCGTFILDKGSLTYNPFIGLAFDIAGQTSLYDTAPATADASSMGGVCITYKSDYAPVLELSLGEEVNAEIGYALPAANLPKSKAGVTKFISWSDFKQPTWYKGSLKFSGEEAAKQLASIRFKVQGTPGESSFNIIAFGDYNGCTNTPIAPPNPVDPPNPIDPPLQNPGTFQTWFGTNGEARINTGHDNGTETSGYWFTYSDDSDGGLSQIIWPVQLGNEYDVNAMDYVIVHCNGLCGTAALDKGNLMYNPFVAVGFLMAGEKSDTNYTPATTDASDMGGICITYTSEVAPSLELGLAEEVEAAIGYAVPAVSLPRSISGTTKFIKWSEFKQPAWYKGDAKLSGEQAAKQLASLKFKMQATPGSYNFNIQAIGPYNGGACVGAMVVPTAN